MKETNKLLADFLELETTEFHGNLFLTQDGILELESDEIWNPRLDWNQLMQVIDKILIICSKLDDMERFFLIKDEIPNMYNTYEMCVKFVNWYNKNIKNV